MTPRFPIRRSLALLATGSLLAGCVVGGQPARPTPTAFPTLEPTAPTTPRPSPVEPLVPDLAYQPLSDFTATQDEAGNRALRFTGSIMNIGNGPLIVHAERATAGAEDWVVTQRIADGAGGYVELPTDTTLVFGGHGHEHWHIDAEISYELYALEGNVLATRKKAGFCYFDQVQLPNPGPLVPPEMVFRPERCGRPGDVWIEMGISVGWADPYHWTLEDQDLDITGLPDGRYRVVATADPDGWFQETDETNNVTETIVELTTNAEGLPLVTVVEE